MDPGDTERPTLQGAPGQDHRPRSHHRNRRRQLPLPADGRESEEQTHGLIAALAGLRASATLQPEAQRLSIPLVQRTATGGPKLIATNVPRTVAKLKQYADVAFWNRRERIVGVAHIPNPSQSKGYHLSGSVGVDPKYRRVRSV